MKKFMGIHTGNCSKRISQKNVVAKVTNNTEQVFIFLLESTS